MKIPLKGKNPPKKTLMGVPFRNPPILQLARPALSTIHFASSVEPKRTKAALSGLPSPGKTWHSAEKTGGKAPLSHGIPSASIHKRPQASRNRLD